MDTPPRSPPEPPPDKELLEMVGAASVPTQLKERPEMTSRQRWHWAYNQIVMQLRVSKSYFDLGIQNEYCYIEKCFINSRLLNNIKKFRIFNESELL